MHVENKQDDASSLVGEGSETMEGKVKLRHPRLLHHKNDEDFQKRRHTTTAVIDFSNIPSVSWELYSLLDRVGNFSFLVF